MDLDPVFLCAASGCDSESNAQAIFKAEDTMKRNTMLHTLGCALIAAATFAAPAGDGPREETERRIHLGG